MLVFNCSSFNHHSNLIPFGNETFSTNVIPLLAVGAIGLASLWVYNQWTSKDKQTGHLSHIGRLPEELIEKILCASSQLHTREVCNQWNRILFMDKQAIRTNVIDTVEKIRSKLPGALDRAPRIVRAKIIFLANGRIRKVTKPSFTPSLPKKVKEGEATIELCLHAKLERESLLEFSCSHLTPLNPLQKKTQECLEFALRKAIVHSENKALSNGLYHWKDFRDSTAPIEELLSQ